MKDYKYIAFGITNQCINDYLLPFFDFDKIDIGDVVAELTELQFKFLLSNIYIILSENGFNAFSLDKISYKMLKEIYNRSIFIDKDFIKWGLNRGFMTLRMSERKKLYKILENKNSIYEKSLPHKWFFNEIMEYNINDNDRFDNESKLTITSFPSNKHGFEMKEVKKW